MSSDSCVGVRVCGVWWWRNVRRTRHRQNLKRLLWALFMPLVLLHQVSWNAQMSRRTPSSLLGYWTIGVTISMKAIQNPFRRFQDRHQNLSQRNASCRPLVNSNIFPFLSQLRTSLLVWSTTSSEGLNWLRLFPASSLSSSWYFFTCGSFEKLQGRVIHQVC